MSVTGIDVAASLALADVPGIGTIGYARLVRHFGSAGAVLAAGRARLEGETGLRAPLAAAVAATRPDDGVRRRMTWAARNGARILPLEDPDYPGLLAEIADPPPILYVKGDGLADCGRTIGVVGSRRISPYGREMTRALCEAFARWGITVVSGLALGVDGQAHHAALEAGGNTVAVLGTGLDRPYPPEHLELCGRVARQGAVVTEFSPGTRPLGAHFPRRNRIISGLSLGVVVVEAERGSGSLITARLAGEQGRGVFAVPGNVDQPGARGTNALIREGATLVTAPEDVVAELLPHLAATLPGAAEAREGAPAAPELGELPSRVFAELSATPVSVDQLAEGLALDTGTLLGALLDLEMGGWVEKLPGNRYIRTPRCR
ncbi:MAG: DNA-protecting protein DprA [Nitrospirae bacterium]|nr:DNA-protecting protein DprA [Nitrospirota bacterium]